MSHILPLWRIDSTKYCPSTTNKAFNIIFIGFGGQQESLNLHSLKLPSQQAIHLLLFIIEYYLIIHKLGFLLYGSKRMPS